MIAMTIIIIAMPMTEMICSANMYVLRDGLLFTIMWLKRWCFPIRIFFHVEVLIENILTWKNYQFMPLRCLYVHRLFILHSYVCNRVSNRLESTERRRWFESYEFRYIRQEHEANKCLFIENHFPWNDYGAYNNTSGRRCICNISTHT